MHLVPREQPASLSGLQANSSSTHSVHPEPRSHISPGSRIPLLHGPVSVSADDEPGSEVDVGSTAEVDSAEVDSTEVDSRDIELESSGVTVASSSESNGLDVGLGDEIDVGSSLPLVAEIADVPSLSELPLASVGLQTPPLQVRPSSHTVPAAQRHSIVPGSHGTSSGEKHPDPRWMAKPTRRPGRCHRPRVDACLRGPVRSIRRADQRMSTTLSCRGGRRASRAFEGTLPVTMYSWLRPLLFRLDPEYAHRLAIVACRVAGSSALLRAFTRAWLGPGGDRPVTAFGLRFHNPIGLAAGFDKDGLAWKGLASLGFGHVEVGTVTPRPQPGNAKPRVFRLTEDASLINRLGFPGEGAEIVASRVGRERPHGVVLGINLGKNRDTPLTEAAADYEQLVDRFSDRADYLVVNVSSPNTVGLRELQGRAHLRGLLGSVLARRDAQTVRRPVLVKLSPDLDDRELDDALDVILELGLDGAIATNTTLARPSTLRSRLAHETGGLSGAALQDRSLAMVRAIHERTRGTLPVIGVGGICTGDHAKRVLDAGAILVQVYTGLIYEGPRLVRRILRELAD